MKPLHIAIEDVRPCVDCGRFPAKRVTGDVVDVEATAFRDGADKIHVVLQWRRHGDDAWHEAPMSLVNPGLDRWRGAFRVDEMGRYEYRIAAWTDPFATWVDELRRKVEGGRRDLESEIIEGGALVGRYRPDVAARLHELVHGDPRVALELVSRPELLEELARLQPREDLAVSEPFRLVVDRPRALFGAWYEMFVRSQTPDPSRPGTFRDAERRLPDIARMGFDVIYLAPIHPIGITHRKGKDNAPVAGPGDPGSPWAIGNADGGHDAIDPALGTVDDFLHFVEAARAHGIEIAMDFAAQCSPDHPWVRTHPEFFRHRPDGTIKYAENPPKKYEDIYPLDFDSPAWRALWEELRRILQVWIDRGVRIFRVDNPHTKPLAFWEWLIADVKDRYPDVIFLSEAFTLPPMMRRLAKLGFSQSYTYFTWRETKRELMDYLGELTQTEMREYFRPNFFANTPDINPWFLQRGGRPAFKIRAVLAGTLSPTWGITNGYELCEAEAVPDKEEYLHSEKYEIKPRHWDAPWNIKDWIARVNRARRENPALHELVNLRFVHTTSDHILGYVKATRDRHNAVIVAASVDPCHVREGMIYVPLEEIGVPPGGRYTARDYLTGESYDWGAENYVRLAPERPAHILRVERRSG